ncbi:MAG: signal peptidase I [Bacteroidia bacterium]|nr:signal peptidase I [Bacteroidia bacterium]
MFTFFILKVFVFEFCVVNSADMADTIHKGDIVFVNKLVFNYEKEDVLYFEFPAKDSGEKKAFFMQRLVAEPGDTVMIMNKTIFTNDRIFDDPLSIKFNYILDTDTAKIDSLTKARYKLYEGGSISKKGKYAYSLTNSQADSVKRLYFVKNMEMRTEKADIYDERAFPYSRLFSWNADNFGKLYVPKKNDTLTLDTVSIKLYFKIITSYEKNKLEIKSDSIFINDELTKHYKVKQDYYFVMGDNRDNAIDSRQWGFLPKSYIKGKVLGVLVHKDKP